jgi:bacterial/archaeal transporter family protein
MPSWLVPSLVYVVFLGSLGVTTRLALEHITWQAVIVWTTIVYVLISAVMLALGQAKIGFGAGTVPALGSAILASTALIALYIALGRGEASTVVPFTSIYPVITLILSALVLAEKITPLKGAGTLVVVVGVVMISLGS